MARIPDEDWDEVGDLVDAALDRPPAERDSLLKAACGADPVRLEKARRVLADAERAQDFLAQPVAALAPDLVRAAVAERDAVGDTPAPPDLEAAGSYRILRHLGRGGMGDVYLAERADDEYRRQVAIKVVRAAPGGDMAARFRHERQVLASLDHPNIARLYDGGVTADGRPYLVMEHVAGRPIDRYAAERTLAIDARLALFDQVCDAVSHAHRSLVVHRDLKPANILVTDEGVVKLLDFGVAKLLEGQPERDDAPVTREGLRVMTPEYASPEQFLGEPVTTATDVYALGLLLFELLTGERPRARVESSPVDLERAVLEGDVARPSDVVRRRAASDPGATGLARALRGDLDTIVQQALARDPHARYSSADALRADIRRHRDGLPVLARPATPGYRAAKFVRRHRGGVAAAVLVLAVATGGAWATLVQARAAAREGERATRIRDFLVSVFENADPDRAAGDTLTARELLDRGADRVERELAGEPELRAEMLGVLGTVMARLGVYDGARTQLERALALRRTPGTPGDVLADSLDDLATVLVAQAKYDEAERLLKEALALRQAHRGPRSAEAASATRGLAAIHRLRGQHAAAEPLYREALDAHRALDDRAGTADDLNGLALNVMDAGRPADAVPLLREAIALRRQAHGERHTEVAESVCNLGTALSDAGKLDEAVAAYDECLAIRRELLGPAHPAIGRTLNNIANVHFKRGDADRAEPLHREALEIRRQAFGSHHPEVAASLNNLATLAYLRGDYAAAAARFREILDVWTALVGADHPNALTTSNNLGMALKDAGDVSEAEMVLRDTLDRRRRRLGPAHPQVGESLMNLGGLYEKTQQYGRAVPLLREAIALLDAAFPDGHPLTGSGEAVLGRVLARMSRYRDALPHLERGLALRAAHLGDDHVRIADSRFWLGRCLLELGRRDEAVAALGAAHRALAAGHGEQSAQAREAAEVLARAQR